MINETTPSDSRLASIFESKPLGQELQEANAPPVSYANIRRLRPNLPRQDLFARDAREAYLRIGVPLYEASIKCDWKAAKAILDKYPQMELIRCSITENGETALHVASSAKGPKVEEFVKKLLERMENKDLELENENFNTALYLAAAAGNIKVVKIMVKKNRILTTIPGARGTMMPLYAAALFGNYEVVKYLYENSNELRDDGWEPQNRGWLLERCVEADMFDIALKIEKTYHGHRSGIVLGVLARKPEAFSETHKNIIKIKRHINSVFAFIGIKVGTLEKEDTALTLLKFIWIDIAKKPKIEIDRILRGPPNSIKQDNKTISGWAIAMQLKNLISDHVVKMEDETMNIITRKHQDSTDQYSIKVRQLQKLISERLLNLNAETQKIIKGHPNLINQDNNWISSKRDQALKLQDLILEHIAIMYGITQMIFKTKRKDQPLQLQHIILEHIHKMDEAAQNINIELKRANETYSSRILFIAAEMGNTKFLVELIRQYPDLIWKVNDDNVSIFHIAVKHRREGIYSLLYEIGAMKNLITPLRDENDNNLLHFAGKMPTKERLADVSGAALQMQRELLWFKEVRSMIPPSYRERVNKDGLTPSALFTEEHKELIREGEKWMKETASQCMVVVALITTIVFAAAFTVPGGYNQNDGIPVFYRTPVFVVFVVADAMSLFLSTASILTFLSILTSRYAKRDFVESLPKKLMLGLLTLFLSIATMVVTFSISFFILYHEEMKWIPILISVVAIMPVILYVVLQFHVLVDVIRSTYGSRYLFKPEKHVLYYVNTESQDPTSVLSEV